MDVELNSLCTSHTACVGNRDGKGNLVIHGELLLVGGKFAKAEGGIAQAVTEREQRPTLHLSLLAVHLVYPAIAHEDVFLVFLVDDLMTFAPSTWIGSQRMRTTLVE